MVQVEILVEVAAEEQAVALLVVGLAEEQIVAPVEAEQEAVGPPELL